MKTRILLSVILVMLAAGNTVALKNPAAVYCEALGYTYVIENSPEGDESRCRFPDGTSCPAQDFIKGRCGDYEKYSYCARNGYGQKTGYGTECSAPYPDADCLVCILEDGKTIEVTKLMNLSFREGICGDGICVLGETHENCPKDCPQSGLDYLCEPIKDGVCDSDCIISREDPDCPITTTTTSSTTSTTYAKKTKCGDGICDTKNGERYGNCPDDCPAGVGDGYCSRLKDGFCDPDCLPGEDPDCVTASTTTTLTLCGNAECEQGENHANCPSDCVRGGRDGFCEPAADGICDPDCAEGTDKDCGRKQGGYMDYLMYTFAFILIVGIVILIYSRMKNR